MPRDMTRDDLAGLTEYDRTAYKALARETPLRVVI